MLNPEVGGLNISKYMSQCKKFCKPQLWGSGHHWKLSSIRGTDINPGIEKKIWIDDRRYENKITNIFVGFL